MSVYVVSDLHGQYKMFRKLLEKVAFSDADKLYMLGDAIDRGPDGIKILQHVKNAPNMEFLLGNHELSEESYIKKLRVDKSKEFEFFQTLFCFLKIF